MALLLYRCRLGIALDDDEPPQHGAIFARHILPGWLAVMAAERDLAVFFLGREQNAPAVVRHPHVIEFGPAFWVNRHCGAQIDEGLLKSFRPHTHPPVDIAGMPAL